MQRFLTLLIIFLGIYSASSGQSKPKSEFGFGLGLNSAAVITVMGTGSTGTNGGFNAGASGDFYFSDRWSFKAKMIFDQKGWSGDDPFGELGAGDYHLNYLTIPLMANWHFGKTRNWYLNAGPYAGFLMSASQSTNNADIKPRFNSTDFGLAFGIGVKFPIAQNAKLFLEYDGQSGLSNIFNSSIQQFQNIRAAFNIGVSFPIY